MHWGVGVGVLGGANWSDQAVRLGFCALIAAAVWVLRHLWAMPAERGRIRRFLSERGCVVRSILWLPFRKGLLIDVGGLEYKPWWGRTYRVTYLNRDREVRVAVCVTGPDRQVFWTDEYPEPGFDRHGNPPNLPTYGQTWRG